MAIRVINGRSYKCLTRNGYEMSKREAQSEAKQLRKKYNSVRVIKTTLGYTVWVPYGW
jgi:hypothetical protein